VSDLGRLNLNIDRVLEEKFRRKVYERKGLKKGNLTNALQEAMVMWINASPPQGGEKDNIQSPKNEESVK